LPDLSAAVDVELEQGQRDRCPRDAPCRVTKLAGEVGVKDTFTVRVLDGGRTQPRAVTSAR
jgi:hypothetical protein